MCFNRGWLYIEDITRWREDMNFIFQRQNNILRTSAASELNIVFWNEKIKFISSSRRVMFFLLYRQKDINKIIEGNYRNYFIDKTHEWDYGKYTFGVPDVVFIILRVVYFPVKHSCLYNRVPMGGWSEPRSPKIFSVEPGAPSLRCLEPWYCFTGEPGALKTFAA